MKILTTVAEAQSLARSKARGLVPTMGALHKAHAELIRVAREHAGRDGEVAVSIFVNPLQFDPGSDYEFYPRPEKVDEEFCRNAGVDFLFRPSAAEMYAGDRSVFVEVQLARIDYVEVVDAITLQPVEMAGPGSVLVLAVFFGRTRLIDNIRLE